MTQTDPSRPVAVVTGGARRIGAAICRALHEADYNLIIHYHNSSQAAEELIASLNLKRPHSATGIQADLNQMAAIQSLGTACINTWGRVDTLINNASSFYPTPLANATEAQWNDLLNSNLKAPFFLSQQLAPALRKQQGCIINIADIFAQRPMPNHTIYSIAKAGNAMMTKAMALELAPNIRVNSVAPGAILWPEDEQGAEIATPEKLDIIPLNKLGGAETIAQAVLFLINQAPYITGHILNVDGGRTLRQ